MIWQRGSTGCLEAGVWVGEQKKHLRSHTFELYLQKTRWSSNLPWVENTHCALFSSSTGPPPFGASMATSPLLFPKQKLEVIVLILQIYICRCKRTLHNWVLYLCKVPMAGKCFCFDDVFLSSLTYTVTTPLTQQGCLEPSIERWGILSW